MCGIRMIFVLGLLALFVSGSRGNLSSMEKSSLSNLVEGASDIFIGISTSLTYAEDESPLSLSNERDWLNYDVTMLPIRVLKGDAICFNEYKPEETGKEITIPFRDRAPFRSSVSPKVYFRPHVGLTYVLFLNKTKNGTYELRDRRLGILPLHSSSGAGKENDLWKMLIETLKSAEIPEFLHAELFDCLLGLDISEVQEEELLQVHQEYYRKLLMIMQEKLDIAEKVKVRSRRDQIEEKVILTD